MAPPSPRPSCQEPPTTSEGGSALSLGFLGVLAGAGLLMGMFNFSGAESEDPVTVKAPSDAPNLLLMDEPTTHLDILSVASLIIALQRYEGTLVFISHDVHFIRKLATKVLHVSKGQIHSYPSDYDYFLEKSGALDNERAALVAE